MKSKSHQKNTKGMLSFLKIKIKILKICDSSCKHQAHGLHTEYIGTLIKAERVIQHWSSSYVYTQTDFLLPFYLLNLVKMYRYTSIGGVIIMTIILSGNSKTIWKNDCEKSKNQRVYSETKFHYKNNWKSTEMERESKMHRYCSCKLFYKFGEISTLSQFLISLHYYNLQDWGHSWSIS